MTLDYAESEILAQQALDRYHAAALNGLWSDAAQAAVVLIAHAEQMALYANRHT